MSAFVHTLASILFGKSCTLRSTNIARENGPFEDVFRIEHGDIPTSYVSLPDGLYLKLLSCLGME